MNRLAKVATPDEVLEAELVIIQAAGIKVHHIGYQQDGLGGGIHLYDVLAPKIPGFKYDDGGFPTRSLAGLRALGLIK